VAGGRVDYPDCPIDVADDIAHAPAAGDLELPLLEFNAVVFVGGKIPPEAVLPIMTGARSRIGP